MNIENEKKWFIYVNDHHEGPFTVSEISDQKNAGTVTSESFVWCEGMNDWLMLSEVKELSHELKRLQPAPAPLSPKSEKPAVKTPGPIKNSTAKKESTTPVAKATPPKTSSKKILLYLGISVTAIALIGLGTLAFLSRYANEAVHVKLRPTFNRMNDKFPGLVNIFHQVPNLQDVSADEQKELESAAQGFPEAGVKVAVALSQNDLNRPVFYVSTNLPDHTKFDVYLVGNPETLLNKLQYSGENTTTTLQGFGKTDVFVADGGQLIPKGEYQVVVMDATDQTETLKATIANLPALKATSPLPAQVPQNAHFIVTKTYFLGGTRDETYLTRLKQFHEKIKQSADHEVLDLKQYSDTLTMQFNSITTEFARIYQAKKMTPGLKAEWKKNTDTWQQINGQLEQTVQTWSKETIQNEFFYGKVFALVKSAYDSIKTLFTLENSYVEQPVDHATFDVQHGKALSETRDALEVLHNKMDVITKAPKTASELPTREGL